MTKLTTEYFSLLQKVGNDHKARESLATLQFEMNAGVFDHQPEFINGTLISKKGTL